jgi:hypothetical protein
MLADNAHVGAMGLCEGILAGYAVKFDEAVMRSARDARSRVSALDRLLRASCFVEDGQFVQRIAG